MTSAFIAPPTLQAGDVVRAIAPSGAFDRQRFDDGVKLIEAAGLNVRYDDGLFSRARYLAGDDERRTVELSHALADREVKAIWCARGGYGATRIIHRAKVEALREAPKWLVGFSDATPLHALWARAGVMSVHGANIDVLARWSQGARDELFGSLMAPAPRIFRGRTMRNGEIISGPITGGNLTVLAAMVGTGTLPAMRGAILFIEDVGERPYRLDRVLTQMIRGGALEGVVGVAIGQLTDCEEPGASFTALDVIADILAPLRVPVIAELALGHEPETSRAIVFGATATIDAAEGVLTVAKA